MNNKPPPEAAWYDDFYQAVQVMGPWYYFMIPYLRTVVTPATKLLELGCGQGHVLRYLVEKNIARQNQIYGMDQSKTAVDFVKNFLPQAHLSTGDICQLNYEKEFFDVCLLMETIEHLEDPDHALKVIHSVIAPNGLLFISFPNYLHLPWLLVRILAEKLNKPNWVVLQPIDKIYTVFTVKRLLKKAGFTFKTAIGSNYGPPVFYPLETEAITKSLNKIGLWPLSFHPILVFQKS